MRLQRSVGMLFAAFLVATGWAGAQEKFALKNNDRVVFYGDNVTEVQFYDNVDEPRLYTTFVETYAVTRFPRLHFTFINSAWGGDQVTGGHGGPIDLRLQRDVIAHQPTVVAIMLGMNDGRGLPYDPQLFDIFATGYAHIAKVLRDALPGIRITVMQPSPYDDVTRSTAFEGGYNSVLLRYGEYVKELGQREGLTVADLNAPLVAVLKRAQNAEPALAREIVPDRTHPGSAGHLILAEALLKAWHAPAIVSSVEVDAARGHVVSSKNAFVTDLQTGHNVSWTETDKALPFPIDMSDPVVDLVVRCSDVVQALNQQPLKITGLSASRYRLKIDGEQIAFFDKQQLEEGINLALLDTPMKKQARRVYSLTLKRNDVYFGRWRQVQVPRGVLYKEPVGQAVLNAPAGYAPALQDDSPALTQAALRAMDNLEQDLVNEQRAAAQPKARHYELVPE